jgi:hypothetical protein
MAYADPGSGAILWQLFFASVVSVGFHFRKLRLWIARRWSRRTAAILLPTAVPEHPGPGPQPDRTGTG